MSKVDSILDSIKVICLSDEEHIGYAVGKSVIEAKQQLLQEILGVLPKRVHMPKERDVLHGFISVMFNKQ